MQQIGRALHVIRHERLVDARCRRPRDNLGVDVFIIIRIGANRVFKYGRVCGYAQDTLLDGLRAARRK